MAFNPTLRYLEKFNKGEFSSPEWFTQTIEGVLTIPGIPVSRIAEQKEKIVIRSDDVFIATYPKCGTTWMQQIVKLITSNGVETGIHHDVAVPWIEQMYLEEIESMPSPRFFKTHLPYKLMAGGGDPEKTKGKYIYVIRNPKDVLVSFFNHMKNFLRSLHWEEFFKMYTAENDSVIPSGTFHSHFLGWWAHKDASNILFITYEQMKRDLRSAITTVAKFIGHNLTDEVIDTIVIETSFDKMKDNEAANKKYWDLDTPFMRKGIIGDWRSVLTAEESARIDDIVADKFAGTGLVFDYGDV